MSRKRLLDRFTATALHRLVSRVHGSNDLLNSFQSVAVPLQVRKLNKRLCCHIA